MPLQETDVPKGPLRERVKELECLQAIVAIIETPGLSSEKMIQGIVDVIPSGWQHPERCRARIKIHKGVFQTPGFVETPWMQRVSLRAGGTTVGSLEVCYMEAGPLVHENVFILEEKKLIELIGNRLGRLIEERESADRSSGIAPSGETAGKSRAEWRIIMDLLRETDPMLYQRVLRRLMNHLHWQGVPGVQGLLFHLTPEFYSLTESAPDENQPQPVQSVERLSKVFEAALWIASLALSDAELSALIKQWMKQDKLGFFMVATEKREISVVEIKDILNRFCRSTGEEEQALAPADDLQARIALVRRFLSERLAFIRIARDYMTVHDFGRLLPRVYGPTYGTGKLGGKSAGMILAEHILRLKAKTDPALGTVKMPESWFITSDGVMEFIHYNYLEDFQSFKFRPIEEIRHNYPYLVQVCKQSFFSPDMLSQLKLILDDAGEHPLIIRSSSLLEDSRGSAFSGKYRSLFLANTGTKEERLAALTDAVAEVYASIFNPDAIEYRSERGLLDYYEEMGVLVQKVVGTRVGKFFFPAFAGVAFNNNEFRWSPRIKREDGVLRLVAGLGTRAVDRVSNDYPLLVSPGQPGIRVNVMPDQVIHYSQKSIDVINLETRRFETHPVEEIVKEVGTDFPLWDRLLSVWDGQSVRRANAVMDRPDRDPVVVTFDGLLGGTPFLRQMKEIMAVLKDIFGMPMDVEFAHDGKDFYILQCRPQSRLDDEEAIAIPAWIPDEHKLFSAKRYITNADVREVKTIIYVDPEAYGRMASLSDMGAVGDAVSRLNSLLPRKSFILMGPGRWGSRGDIKLGVRVSYSDINNSAMLIEVARKVGDYVPDLSFGTHFFQDLVESRIRYLALYPDDHNVIFAHDFFRKSANALTRYLPEYAYLASVLRVIDVPEITGGLAVRVIMDGDRETALGFLYDPGK
ncbi:MAG: PEP/pyruvate-binding domain-containing protein, partial [Candidatus Aminicenantes bacterium]|nr:PEP/pyruvate-binding domain-containing protein [Candidatus Aminicenantes bacterium]